MKTINAITIGILITLNAFAQGGGGDRVGNGGDALVCNNSVVRFLDHFEAEQNDLDLEIKGTTLREKVTSLISRVKRLDVETASILKKYAIEMVVDIEKKEADEKYRMKVIKLSDKVVLTDIDDSRELALPIGCEKKQLVIQRTPILPEDRFYEIDKILWDKMDLDNQAMTITHEAWYRFHISKGALDSRYSRYMNGLFASRESEDLNLGDYFLRLRKATSYSKFIESSVLLYTKTINGIKMDFVPYNSVLNISENLEVDAHRGFVSSESEHYFKTELEDYKRYNKLTLKQDGAIVKTEGTQSTAVFNGDLNFLEKDSDCNVKEYFETGIKEVACYAVRRVIYKKVLYRSKGPYDFLSVEFKVDKNGNYITMKISK